MTFSTDTTGKRGYPIRYAVTIQGLEQVLVETTFASASIQDQDGNTPFTEGSARTQLAVIAEAPSVGETQLDLDVNRRQSGGSLTVRLRDSSDALLALFAPRTRAPTRLVTDIAKATAMTGAGTVTVNSTAALDAAGYVIIGAETFRYTGVTTSPDTLTGVTRAAYGSRAQAHWGGSKEGEGSGVHQSAPGWRGRRVTLYAGYQAPDGTFADVYAMGTYQLERPPQHEGGDEWTLSCAELSDWYWQAPVYRGLRALQPTGVQYEDVLSARDGTITLQSTAQFVKGTKRTYALFKMANGAFHTRKVGNVTSTTVVLADGDKVSPDYRRFSELSTADPLAVYRWETVRHVAYLNGDPATITLQLILSRVGDEANSGYDVLPGRARTDFGGEEWFMGAGIESTDIDVASFEALRGRGVQWTMLLNEPMTVGELILEFCSSVGAFAYVDTSGRLAVEPIRERLPPSTSAEAVALDDSTQQHDSDEMASPDESNINHTVQLQANWDPLQGKFLAVVTVLDGELADRYPESSRSLAIASKVISINTSGLETPGSQTLRRGSTASIDGIEVMLRRAQQYSARPRYETSVTADWKASLLRPGQVVALTNARLPDLEGGRLSTASNFLIVGRRPDLSSGTVELRLRKLDNGYLLAPVALVSSWDGGTKTLTLDTTPTYETSGGSPGLDFLAGWGVHVVDTSPATWVLDVNEVASVTATTIVLTSTPSFTPKSGDFVQVISDTLGKSVRGYAPQDAIYQVSDAGAAPATRWS